MSHHYLSLLYVCSKAIITYLMNKYAADSDLYPKDPASRAQVDQRLYFDSALFASIRGIVVSIRGIVVSSGTIISML